MRSKRLSAVQRAAAKSDAGSNELVKAVVADFETKEGSRSWSPAPALAGAKPADAVQRSLRICGRCQLPQCQGSPRRGRLQGLVAGHQQELAEASSEGGFLGIGGVQVSDAEKATLAEYQRRTAAERFIRFLGNPDLARAEATGCSAVRRPPHHPAQALPLFEGRFHVFGRRSRSVLNGWRVAPKRTHSVFFAAGVTATSHIQKSSDRLPSISISRRFNSVRAATTSCAIFGGYPSLLFQEIPRSR